MDVESLGQDFAIPVSGNELEAIEGLQICDTGPAMPLSPFSENGDAIFKYIHEGIATNLFAEIRSNPVNADGTYKEREGSYFDFNDNSLTITNGNFKVVLRNATQSTGLRTLTHLLLHALVMEFTENERQDNIVAIPLRKYMELRDIKKEQRAREQVKEDLQTLANVELYFTERSRGRRPQDYASIRVIQAHSIKNSVIYVMFSTPYADILRKYPVMAIPLLMYQVNPQLRPYAHPMLWKILTHKRMNAGKPNENSIAVATLLDAGGFPKYDDIKDTGQLKQRTRIPFENNLDEWRDLFSWEYWHANGEPVTDEELRDLPYKTFVTLYVHIHWHYYPDQTQRLEYQKRKIKEAQRKKERRQARAAAQEQGTLS